MEASGQTDQELRAKAVESLKKKREFRMHALIYVLVNALIVVIWAVTRDSGDFFWPIFVIVGWGIGLAANAWDVYGSKSITEDDIRREQDRLRG